ncbi:MAG: transporter substrate-binding domain-containing protein [Planctomycetota bacterium]|nr:transporter substrate-binding domain-containing protein [Planctomycetota bacterium]
MPLSLRNVLQHHLLRTPALLVLATVGLASLPQIVAAQTDDANAQSSSETTLVVGTKASAPFSIKGDDGEWSGISIELWEEVADTLGFQIEYREVELVQMFKDLESGDLDVGVAALSITSEREQQVDFSHSYYSSGLGIAVPTGGGSYLNAIRGLISWQFIKLIMFMLAILAAIGLLVWFLERNKNAEQFGGNPIKGMGSGLWWSAVTMTTVGYGDKAPVTFAGRVVGLIWMFASLMAISTFTAAIASVITVSQLESSISGPEDLVRNRVGTVANSTSLSFLRNRDINANTYADAAEGINAIIADREDAFVYDAPILQYHANLDPEGRATILPITFNHQQYGFALQPGSPHREAINRAMLEILASDRWAEIEGKYLGN